MAVVEIKGDLKHIKHLKKVNDYLKSHRLVFGFVGDEKGEDGTPVSEYAYYVEFGLMKGGVPRPFFRNGRKEYEKDFFKKFKALYYECVKTFADPSIILETLGLEGVGIIQESIVRGGYAPNKESTLKQKKGSKPLIDTNTMLQSVKHKIEEV